MAIRHVAFFPLLLYPMCTNLSAGQTSPPTPAIVYLQDSSDRFQNTIDVYSDSDAAGNHFAARGEIHIQNGPVTPTMDEISSSVDCFGITCITARFNGTGNNWGGWYWLNGLLGSNDRQPSLNWGDKPDAGYDLSGATALQFWAKGATGNEVVEFFAFGVGYDPDTGARLALYPDSAMKVTTGAIRLSTAWTQYSVPISGLDIHYILGGFGWVAAAANQTNPQQPITFYIDSVQYIKSRPSAPRFLVSYETIKSSNSFDSVQRNAAYVYDNAVALIALLNAGDLAHARTIADAMLYAQAHDRFFLDGRVRNAYQGGDINLPPGWLPNNRAATVRMPGWYDAGRTTWLEDETQVSSNTGNIAWSMLALLYFYEETKEQKYLTAVDKLGNWVLANTSDSRGSGGFAAGYDGWEGGAAAGSTGSCASAVFVNGQCKRLYKSTEHNIDLYSAFSRLYLIEGLDQWKQAAQAAKGFFLSMWDPVEDKFWTGTGEDGVTVSTNVIPLDIQAWSIEALGVDAGPYVKALDYAEANHKTTLGYGFKQNGGNACGDNTWFEGTSQVAIAYLLSGNRAKWQAILGGIHSVQTASGVVPATDGSCLNTGFTLNDGQPWEYFPRGHVGATAWLGLAEAGMNPFRSELYAPRVLPTVKVTPSSSSITMTQPLKVTVVVSGGSGNPVPTGSVTLTSGGHPSAATTLTGGSASFTVPAGSLPLGTDTLTATYAPDSSSIFTYKGAFGTASVHVVQPASLSSPVPGSTLTGPTVTFAWTPGTGVTTYGLWVSAVGPGLSDIYKSPYLNTTSATVSGLPTNGAKVYVRLFSSVNGAWQSVDYTYTAFGTPKPASLSSPVPGSTLTGPTVTFAWTPGTGVTTYGLWVSAVGPGLSDIYKSPYLNTTSATVSGLPTNGAKVYVRLFSSVNGAWQSVDYTYTAYAAPAGLTSVQIPDITLNGLGQTIAPIDLTNHIQSGDGSVRGWPLG
jgi:hypothetical protein